MQRRDFLGWLTRIATFRFPNCGPQAPKGAITGQVSDVATGAPIAGAIVSVTPGVSGAVTNGSGIYAATVPTGTYSLTVSVGNHPHQSVFGVVVADGGTATVNFALALRRGPGFLQAAFAMRRRTRPSPTPS